MVEDDGGGGGVGMEVCDEAVDEELEMEIVEDDVEELVVLTGEGRLATVEWLPWTGEARCVLEED